MKRFLIIPIIFLLASPLCAMQPAMLGVAGAGGAAACSSVTVDHWQAFEASDFLTSPPAGWSVVDASGKLSKSATGEQATLSCMGGVTDTGTSGIAYSLADGAIAYAAYTFAAKTTYSIGFWYKTPTVGAWQGPEYVASGFDSSGTPAYVFNINIKRDGAGPFMAMYAGSNSSTISVSAGTWYWITALYVEGGTNKLRIYDTSGNLVGDEVTATDRAGPSNSTNVRLGPHATGDNIASTAYYDDFVIDYTDATFPLGP